MVHQYDTNGAIAMLANERINIRVSKHAKMMIEQTCQQLGVSVSSFMAQSAYEKALALNSSFADPAVIRLNNDEWQNALSLLDDEPDPRMSALLARGYRAVGH